MDVYSLLSFQNRTLATATPNVYFINEEDMTTISTFPAWYDTKAYDEAATWEDKARIFNSFISEHQDTLLGAVQAPNINYLSGNKLISSILLSDKLTIAPNSAYSVLAKVSINDAIRLDAFHLMIESFPARFYTDQSYMVLANASTYPRLDLFLEGADPQLFYDRGAIVGYMDTTDMAQVFSEYIWIAVEELKRELSFHETIRQAQVQKFIDKILKSHEYAMKRGMTDESLTVFKKEITETRMNWVDIEDENFYNFVIAIGDIGMWWHYIQTKLMSNRVYNNNGDISLVALSSAIKHSFRALYAASNRGTAYISKMLTMPDSDLQQWQHECFLSAYTLLHRTFDNHFDQP